LGNWTGSFKKTMQWLFVLFLVGAIVLSMVMIYNDLKSSYYGWGRGFSELSAELGNALAMVATILPTLIQLLAWTGVGAESEAINHNTFKLLVAISIAADTIGDCIYLKVFGNFAAGDWRKVALGLITVIGFWGFLSEFLLGYSVASLIAQIRSMNVNLGFSKGGGASRSVPSLSGIMGGGLDRSRTSRPGPLPSFSDKPPTRSRSTKSSRRRPSLNIKPGDRGLL